MLDKIAAVELKNYIYNCTNSEYGTVLEKIDWYDMVTYARMYNAEFCGTDEFYLETFSHCTIAYSYGLLQGLKEND